MPVPGLYDMLVERSGQLYSLPRVAMQVLELTRDPEVDARSLKETIERDPALTSKILRVVNSSLFGLSREVRDLNQALALLGIKPLKLLVLGFSLPERLFAGVQAEFLERYWQHTLFRAVAAREITKAAWGSAGDEAFLAGLLEDLGLLVLVQELREPYAAFVTRAWNTGSDLRRAERETLGFDHRQLTMRLLAKWNLPDTLVAAAALPAAGPFDRMQPTRRSMPAILELADKVADFLSERRLELLTEIVVEAKREHSLDAQKLRELLQTMQEKVSQLADVLSLKLPAGFDMSGLLAEAQERLTLVAVDAALDLACSNRKDTAAIDERALWHETRELTLALDGLLGRTTIDKCSHDLSQAASKSAAAGAMPASRNSHSNINSVRPSHETSPRQHPKAAVEPRADPRAGTTLTVADDQAEAALAAQLSSAATTCRAGREPLGLLLVAIDRYEDFAFTHGTVETRRIAGEVQELCAALEGAILLPMGAGTTAALLPKHDRRESGTAGQQLLTQVRGLCESLTPGDLSVSIGIATVDAVSKNFAPQELILAARRCRDAAHRSGGNCVKSIEIY